MSRNELKNLILKMTFCSIRTSLIRILNSWWKTFNYRSTILRMTNCLATMREIKKDRKVTKNIKCRKRLDLPTTSSSSILPRFYIIHIKMIFWQWLRQIKIPHRTKSQINFNKRWIPSWTFAKITQKSLSCDKIGQNKLENGLLVKKWPKKCIGKILHSF